MWRGKGGRETRRGALVRLVVWRQNVRQIWHCEMLPLSTLCVPHPVPLSAAVSPNGPHRLCGAALERRQALKIGDLSRTMFALHK